MISLPPDKLLSMMENTMASKTAKALIYGRVQGVYFRYHTKLMADNFGLSGWVRNRSDGSVEAYLSGSGSDVAKMIDWLHRGPETAVVDKVDVAEIDNDRMQDSNFIIKS